MDTPEPQKQFELWWVWHSISRLKSLSQENSGPKCRNDIVVFTNNKTKHWCKCLDTLSKQIKQYPPKSGTISEPSTSSYTSQRNPKASWGFPPQYPTPRPQPNLSSTSTAAFASRSRSTTESWPLRAAKSSGVLPREPRPEAKPQAEPNGTRGRKILRKFWAPQKSKFGKFWPLKILPELKEHCAFEEVLMTSSWLKKAMWTRLAVKMLWGNFKNVPSLRKQVCVRLGHNRIWNQSRAVDISCNRVRGLARILTGKKHKFLRFVRTAIKWSCQAVLDYCTSIYHIRMDTPEPQKQFELWWAWHSISRLKSLSQENSDPKCRNNIVVFTNNNTKHWCKCLDTLSKQIKQYPPKSGTISEPSTSSYTSQRNPKASWGFPPQYPTPRPRLSSFSTSTAAFASRSRSTTESWPLRAAASSGVLPREPRPEASHRQNPTERRGEKFSENLGASKVEVLEIVATQNTKNPPWTSGTLWFLRCLEAIKLVEDHCCLWILAVKMTWINSNHNIYSNSGAK